MPFHDDEQSVTDGVVAGSVHSLEGVAASAYEAVAFGRVGRENAVGRYACLPVGVVGQDVEGVSVEHYWTLMVLQIGVQGSRCVAVAPYARSYSYGLECVGVYGCSRDVGIDVDVYDGLRNGGL